jgi:ubiquitin carboxyl-terminal hydrolase 4/11/15
MELYNTPPIMIIHLKRFKANNKIDTLVDFPVEDLDMSQYLIGPSKDKDNHYELFGVAHHYGGMGGGHYVASAKNYFDGKWYNFNDSSVSGERMDDVVSSSAYVLFYRHKKIKEIIDLKEIYNKKFTDYTPQTTETEEKK